MLHDPAFWFMIAFLLFLGLVGKKAWKFVTAQMDWRKQSIENEIFEAVKLHEKAQAFLDEMKQKNQQAEQHAEEILAHARQESERLQAEATKEIEAFIKRREKLAEEKIAYAESQALKDIHTRAIEVGIEASEKILHTTIDQKNGAKLIDQALDEIERDVQWRP
ncbi:MAG: F0F1 ATP synthase subunit B [Alphaproteobacteria bacterium]|nr:F0F1 ATP synthase subunit B [Alphaproteobacteria bacterium]